MIFIVSVVVDYTVFAPDILQRFILFERAAAIWQPEIKSLLTTAVFAIFPFIIGLQAISRLKERSIKNPTMMSGLLNGVATTFTAIAVGFISAISIYLFVEYITW